MAGPELLDPPVKPTPDPSGLFKDRYIPLNWARDYHKAREWARVRMATGGTGSGKTHTNKSEFFYLAWLFGGQWIAVAQTINKSRTIQFEEILKIMSNKMIDKAKITRQPELSIILPSSGGGYAKIKFEGADESNVKAEGKKRGIEVEGVWLTEASTMMDEKVDAQLHLRTRMAKRPRFLYDTNPEGPDHWLIEKYFPKGAPPVLMELDDDWEKGVRTDKERGIYWQSLTIKHNNHLPPRNVAEIIENAKPENGYWFRRMILGHWVAPEGSVFGESANVYAANVQLDG